MVKGLKKKSINQWSEDSRPRERLLKNGASTLSNAELLAILIGSGSAEEDAVSLMQHVLDSQDGDLDKFGRLTYEDFIQYKGIGPAKAITLLAALQFAQRRADTKPTNKTQLNTPQAFYQFLCPKMRDEVVEVCWAVLLDQHLHYIADRKMSEGGITSTVVDPRILLRYAIVNNAAALVLAHNHPSGSTQPSHEDDNLTDRMKHACDSIGIRFVDHLIITGIGYYSYGERGKI